MRNEAAGKGKGGDLVSERSETKERHEGVWLDGTESEEEEGSFGANMSGRLMARRGVLLGPYDFPNQTTTPHVTINPPPLPSDVIRHVISLIPSFLFLFSRR